MADSLDFDATAAGIAGARERAGLITYLPARLVSAAEPGQILAGTDVRDALPDWPVGTQEPLALKGFDAPVTVYDLHVGARR